ncbi:Ulp1 protease family, C-terminal catalytic domain containing [Olea europaea subsp. europaea]|uniref:Ulp1 protease family, C-terminal catalytic domain containing n=1 Tax=Olea europaea subsp. europaea TaxID=158383 RepID=A0A8S0TVY0_OLEEU|nr:Ulp1 protease family, C-terminal catalytic domain containing [Olea europaea subsp. europaea]
MLAGNEEQTKDVTSPSNKDRIELLEEVELKDDVWEIVVEVTATIEAETEIEEGNVETIDIDDIVRKTLVLEAIKPFSDIIPNLLFHTGFFEGKDVSEEEGLNPLVVKMVSKLPQQNNGGDCGIYVIKYAQYFINGMLNEMSKSFNVPHLRRNLTAQLYVYGKKKQEEEYDTNNEWGSKEMKYLYPDVIDK